MNTSKFTPPQPDPHARELLAEAVLEAVREGATQLTSILGAVRRRYPSVSSRAVVDTIGALVLEQRLIPATVERPFGTRP